MLRAKLQPQHLPGPSSMPLVARGQNQRYNQRHIGAPTHSICALGQSERLRAFASGPYRLRGGSRAAGWRAASSGWGRIGAGRKSLNTAEINTGDNSPSRVLLTGLVDPYHRRRRTRMVGGDNRLRRSLCRPPTDEDLARRIFRILGLRCVNRFPGGCALLTKISASGRNHAGSSSVQTRSPTTSGQVATWT